MTLTTPPPAAAPQNDPKPEERAEALYRLVRPTHLTLPNSEQRAVALKVLSLYLQKCGSPDSAAQALKPYAAEADARGIRPTNLCWLSEWAAVGQIPRLRTKGRTNAKRVDVAEDQTDYEALRKRMENELTPLMGDGERNQP